MHPSSSRFRQPDGNSLLCTVSAVLTVSDVFDLFANELSRLRRRGFTFTRIFSGTFYNPLF
jgi:hypothetical protein